MHPDQPAHEVLWSPADDVRATSRIGAYLSWLEQRLGRRFDDYAALWQWSVDDLAGFWSSVWDFFELPANLYLIGTMNSADRSIAQIDVALRRRFHFVRMDPDTDVLRRNLLKWDVAPEVCDWVVSGLEAVNARIARSPGREFRIGHSFFMDKDLDAGRVERIWRHDIAPMLEDIFYDAPQVVQELRALFDAAQPGPVDLTE